MQHLSSFYFFPNFPKHAPSLAYHSIFQVHLFLVVLIESGDGSNCETHFVSVYIFITVEFQKGLFGRSKKISLRSNRSQSGLTGSFPYVSFECLQKTMFLMYLFFDDSHANPSNLSENGTQPLVTLCVHKSLRVDESGDKLRYH